MKRFASLGLLPLLLLGAACLAQEDRDVSWKAKDEIARRGALVERIDGIAGAADSPVGDVLQPPEDDSHKFYFTVVVERGNKLCDQLRYDFEHKLHGWANPGDYRKSWSHFQVVQIEDKTQAWRWKNYRPTKFPTLIVQPPYNESWGDPQTVVFLQEGYSKPEELDKKLRSAFTAFAKKVQPTHVAHHKSGGFEQAGGWTPPVTPVSPLPPAQPTVLPPETAPAVVPTQPAPAPAPAPATNLWTIGLTVLATLLGTGTMGGLVVGGLTLFRAARKASGKTILSDEQFALLMQELKTVLGGKAS